MNALSTVDTHDSSMNNKGKGKVKPGKGIDTGGGMFTTLQFAASSTSKVPMGPETGEEHNWIDTTLNGGSVLLNIVKEASSLAPIPYLKQAAGATLKIVEIIQTVKENKIAFERLGQEAMEFITTVYSAYQRSPNKDNWPPQDIKAVIDDFVRFQRTLADIQAAINKQLRRGKVTRLVYSAADAGKIEEFRQRLKTAIDMFEVSSHLSLHDALSLILQNQMKEEEARRQAELLKARHDIEEVHQRIDAQEREARLHQEVRRLQEEEDNRRRQQAAAEEEIISQQRRIEELDAQNSILRIQVADDLRRRRDDEESALRERQQERSRQQLEEREALERIRAEERAKIELQCRLEIEAELQAKQEARRIQDAINSETKRKRELERRYKKERRRIEELMQKMGSLDISEGSSEVGSGDSSEYETEPDIPVPKKQSQKPPKSELPKTTSPKAHSPAVDNVSNQFAQTILGYPGSIGPWQAGYQYGSTFSALQYAPHSPSVQSYSHPLYPSSYIHQSMPNASHQTIPSGNTPISVHNINSGNIANINITNSGNVTSKQKRKSGRWQLT
ncbi:hypothetical protein JR316_0000077 [Psilocybe cubensis]|uniref:Uncharacterized protein n=2 Tax=Psilocybe cubensis TaxID=181762 RepID=A0A8H7Y8T3_PSICU|nr:hypothetical protein JR316_0000077 [Psilocybe cubensis]KAH9486014.1 hypothetical protein JR316_0000077 [Psilocybe cubensis]